MSRIGDVAEAAAARVHGSSNNIVAWTQQGDDQIKDAKLAAAVKYWHDLDHVRQKSEADAAPLAAEPGRAQQARKNLAAATRALKNQTGHDQAPPPPPAGRKVTTTKTKTQTTGEPQTMTEGGSGIPTGVTALLRAYQSEIDALTKHGTQASRAFASLFAFVADAPDVLPLLQEAGNNRTRVAQLVRETSVQAQRLKEYDAEFQKLKNQEVTIRELEGRLALAQQQAAAASAPATAAAAAFGGPKGQDEANATALLQANKRLGKLTIELEATQATNAQLRGDRDRLTKERVNLQTQLFDLAADNERLAAAKDSGVELMQHDMERIRQARADLTAENSALKQEVERLQNREASRVKEETAAAQRSCKSNHEQRQQQHEAEAARTSDLSLHTQRINELERELSTAQARVTDLSGQLKELPSLRAYRDLQKQVALLQELEFNVIPQSDDSAAGTSQEEGDEAAARRTPQELLLVNRARALQAELTTCRVQLEDVTKARNALQVALGEASADAAQSKQLAARLEDQLMASSSSSSSSSAPTGPAPTKAAAVAGVGAFAAGHSPTSLAATPDALMIVKEQRDRFRARMDALQAEKHSLKQRCDLLQSRVDALKTENVHLYERVKYAQSFRGAAAGSKHGSMDMERGDSGVHKSSAASFATESKYAAVYEATQDPLARFRAKQRKKIYNNLSASEKLSFTVGKLLFSEKRARTVFFFYALVLHILVFWILFHTHPTCDAAVAAAAGGHIGRGGGSLPVLGAGGA